MQPAHALDSRDDVEVTDAVDRTTSDEEGMRDERVVRCAACGHVLTHADERFEKNGRADHVFTNPHGYTFRIGTYTDGPGCAGVGPESDEWVWFPGHVWQTAVCRGCLTHVGWYFRTGEDGFVGLILAKIAR